MINRRDLLLRRRQEIRSTCVQPSQNRSLLTGEITSISGRFACQEAMPKELMDDALSSVIEPLLPKRASANRRYVVRKPTPHRAVLTGTHSCRLRHRLVSAAARTWLRLGRGVLTTAGCMARGRCLATHPGRSNASLLPDGYSPCQASRCLSDSHTALQIYPTFFRFIAVIAIVRRPLNMPRRAPARMSLTK